jgi:predicted TIM-barrel fold metal-dependent hydrolase
MSDQAPGAVDRSSSTPFTIVSGDSHVGLHPEEYRPYLDPQYRDVLDEYIADNVLMQTMFRKLGYPFGLDVLDIVDKRGAISSGGVAGFWDPQRRLRIQAEDGLVAEILHPGGPIAIIPWADLGTSRVSEELRAAGATAYNRFLADYCSVDRKRLLGVPVTYPWPDMAAAARTVKWAGEQGMVGVYPPRFAGAEDDLPAFYDRSWDPFWAACCDAGLPVQVHAGHGKPQGFMLECFKAAVEGTEQGAKALAQIFDSIFDERRPLWQMMWSGVFDRFPDLRVVFAEIRSHWVPPTLDGLTRMNAESGGVLKRSPWEYWERNCAVTPSFMRASDLDVCDRVGSRKTMFGSDYPHAEGTWPNTLDFLRVVLNDISEADARAILGDNAIQFYGLDREYLDILGKRYGPKPADLLGMAHTVEPELIDQFNNRNGLNKKITFEEAQFNEIMVADTESALASR